MTALAALPARQLLAGPASSRLVLLGTGGGPSPKPDRFPSAYALQTDRGIYLIDCGNGVARQVIRAGLDINSIRQVFLTHHHPDHNADVGTLLLLGWATNPGLPVTVWGPPPLKKMMRAFRRFQAFDMETGTADEGRSSFDDCLKVEEFAGEGLLFDDGVFRVTRVQNAHPPFLHSYALRFDGDRSYVFSGDTTCSEAVVALAKDADVLVHEVMHLDAIEPLIATEPDATRLRRHLLASHSTPEQVGRVATRANVKTLVLSHFVPGGHEVTQAQWLDAVCPHFGGEILVGADLLTV